MTVIFAYPISATERAVLQDKFDALGIDCGFAGSMQAAAQAVFASLFDEEATPVQLERSKRESAQLERSVQ